MYRNLFLLLLFSSHLLRGQDKIYFLNGSVQSGKVLEIRPEQVLYLQSGDTVFQAKHAVMFIAFANGKTEVLNRPLWDAAYDPKTQAVQPKGKERAKEQYANQIYLNTLSLVNADFSLYYEYVFKSKPLGVGAFGTYNFNSVAGLANVFFALLPNAKKNFDAGLYFNRYTKGLSNNRFFYGLMLKYTSFRYSAADFDTTYQNGAPNVTVKYYAASDRQISPLFHFGLHNQINDLWFIKTSFSLGFFRLSERYRQQLAYVLTEPGEASPVVSEFLVKGGIGICLGVRF